MDGLDSLSRFISGFERAGKKNSNNTRYQFWQQDYHPIELSTNDMLEQKIDYIHDNPVRSGLVYEAESYIYSSASSYAGRPEKVIDVILAL